MIFVIGCILLIGAFAVGLFIEECENKIEIGLGTLFTIWALAATGLILMGYATAALLWDLVTAGGK